MIRRLNSGDGSVLQTLRQGIASSPPEFMAADVWRDMTDAKWEALLAASEKGTEQILLGAFSATSDASPALAGIVGLRRELRPTTNHKASLWGLYVVPDVRRQGLGTALVATLLDVARQMPDLEMLRLVVLEQNTPAVTLLHKQGFTTYALEPAARFLEGHYYGEAFLLLLL